MRRTASFVVIAALLTASALTATTAMAQNDVERTAQSQQVFFSPSGQPFRAIGTDPYPSALWFAQADKDKDGKISHDEFIADAVQFFNQLDANHDGYINSPENTRYENQIAPEILYVDGRITQPYFHAPEADGSGADQDPNGGKYRKTIEGASQYGLIDEPQPVRAADANFDFRVSRDEWANTSSQRFTILDRNGDGFITADELPKTPFQIALEAPKKGKAKKKGFGW